VQRSPRPLSPALFFSFSFSYVRRRRRTGGSAAVTADERHTVVLCLYTHHRLKHRLSYRLFFLLEKLPTKKKKKKKKEKDKDPINIFIHAARTQTAPLSRAARLHQIQSRADESSRIGFRSTNP
jgi:hypothetical protein